MPTSSPGRFLLTTKGSNAAISHLNEVRLHMDGINRRPLPHGEMTMRSNGFMRLRAADGRDYHLRPNGSIAAFHRGDEHVRFGVDGRMRGFRDPHFEMRRGPGGAWHTVEHRPDHSILRSEGFHRGRLERPIPYGNRGFVRATYVNGHEVSVRVYADYPYHGVVLHRYLPPVYYSSGFYGWASRPWTAPAAYHWGFVASPGYAATAGYFAVAPSYPAPAPWMADFMLSSLTVAQQFVPKDGTAAAPDPDNLPPPDDGSADNPDAAAAGDSSTDAGLDALDDADQPQVVASDADAPITQPLKDQLAAEIREQVELDSAGQPVGEGDPGIGLDGLPARLSHPGYLFVVSEEQSTNTVDGEVCRLQPGDTVRLAKPVSSQDANATLVVSSSRAQDCPAQTSVLLSLNAMQDMWNDMRALMESGLSKLRFDPANGGLPSPPLAVISAPLQQGVPRDLATPDPDAGVLLDAQQNVAAGKEMEMEADIASSPQ